MTWKDVSIHLIWASLIAFSVACCTLNESKADDSVFGPKDTHIGILYMVDKPVKNLGEFWSLKHCEFIGKGIENHFKEKTLQRPYETTPQQALVWMTAKVKCERK